MGEKPVQAPRSRTAYGVLCLLTMALGLASRHYSELLPAWLAKNAGDALYATMVFFFLGAVRPHSSTLRLALAAASICFAIEMAKWIDWPWLVALRHNRWGHLILGTGFQASNLVCYLVGVLLPAAAERAHFSQSPRQKVE